MCVCVCVCVCCSYISFFNLLTDDFQSNIYKTKLVDTDHQCKGLKLQSARKCKLTVLLFFISYSNSTLWDGGRPVLQSQTVSSPIHSAVWMPGSCTNSPPLEGVSIVQSDNCTGPSLNLIQRHVPQSSVTGPNDSNVVTGTVFGNL